MSSTRTSRALALVAVALSSPLAGQPGPQAIRFEHNEGQSDPAVRYLARGARHTLFLTPGEAVMVLVDPSGERGVIRSRVVGADVGAEMRPERPLPGRVHYLVGDDPTRWRRGLVTWGRVRVAGILPGIDLVYHGDRGELEYDFEVAPGVDPATIEIELEGARSACLSDAGDLLLETAVGRLVHRRPVAFQRHDGERRPVSARFRLDREARRLGFELGEYDPARPLVIDPVLVWATYLGGSAAETTARVAVDALGHAIVGSQTASADFPTQGALQGSQPGLDAVVTKLTPDGAGIVWSTYLGGSTNEFGPVSVAVAADDSVAVALTSGSPDMPVSGNAFSPQPNRQDAYVAVLSENPSGVTLAYGTFYGGSGFETAEAVTWGVNGLVYLAMATPSRDVPLGQTGAAQPNNAGGTDAFVAAFDPRLPRGLDTLRHATYVGGAGLDRASDLDFDSSPTAPGVVVAGTTRSTNFPVLAGFQASLRGNDDAFVTVLNGQLTQIDYSTYVGGSGSEALDRDSAGLDSDGSGLVYFAGTTNSPDFPLTPDAVDSTFEGREDAFVVVLDVKDLTGGSLVFGSYFGSAGRDFGRDVATDGLGNIYLCGSAAAAGFPATLPLQGFAGGGEGFVAVITAAPRRIAFATPIGGSGTDRVESIEVDAGGNLYVAGITNSLQFPTTAGAFQERPQGRNDLVVARIDFAFADSQSYGQGHPGTLGVPGLTVDAAPILGTTVDLVIGSSRGATTPGALLLGSRAASVPTPVGGTLLLVPQATVNLVVPANGLRMPVTLPGTGCGTTVNLQVLELDPGASRGVSFSRGLRLRLGA